MYLHNSVDAFSLKISGNSSLRKCILPLSNKDIKEIDLLLTLPNSVTLLPYLHN